MAMKIASLKFSEEEKPSFYDIKIDEDGNVFYYNEKGELHRIDGPAVEYADARKEWRQEGRWHRLDGPAIELRDGSKFWYVNDKLHRLDGPAVVGSNGYKAWYIGGELIGKSKDGFTDKDFERWKKEHGYENS